MHRKGVVRRVALAVAVALLVGGSSFAVEPDGFTAIRYEWVDGPPAPGKESALRISVEAVAPVTRLVASYAAPPGVGLREDASAPLRERGTTMLGAAGAGEKRMFLVVVRAPETGGGIVAFRVAGERDGTPFEEGFGLPIGQVGIAPRLVDGALEFPAEENPGPAGR